jgi:hypothetical protein
METSENPSGQGLSLRDFATDLENNGIKAKT